MECISTESKNKLALSIVKIAERFFFQKVLQIP
jgi:hypothetical protein